MKKRYKIALLCVAAFAIGFGGSAGVTGTDEKTIRSAEVKGVSQASFSQGAYIVGEYDGVVAVFKSDSSTPIVETDIIVTGMRENDQALVRGGIRMNTYSEVLCLLEDFGS